MAVAKALLKSYQVTIAATGVAQSIDPAGTIRSADLTLQAEPGNAAAVRMGDADDQAAVVTDQGLSFSDFFSNGVERKIMFDDVMIVGTIGDSVNVIYSVVS